MYKGLHLEGKRQEVLEKHSKRKAVSAVANDVSPDRLILFGETKKHCRPIYMVSCESVEGGDRSHQLKLRGERLHPGTVPYYSKRTEACLQELGSLHEEVKEYQPLFLNNKLGINKYMHNAADHLREDAETIEHIIKPEIEKQLEEN